MANRMVERGSVIGFIAVGIVLLALLIGGIFIARNASQQARPSTTANDSGISNPEPAKPSDTPAQSSPSDAEKKANEQLQRQRAEEAQRAVSESQKSSQTSTAQQPSSEPNTPQSSSAGTLPQTGPADTFLSIAAVGAIAVLGTAYYRSRHAL